MLGAPISHDKEFRAEVCVTFKPFWGRLSVPCVSFFGCSSSCCPTVGHYSGVIQQLYSEHATFRSLHS